MLSIVLLKLCSIFVNKITTTIIIIIIIIIIVEVLKTFLKEAQNVCIETWR